jgi:hypothetical protein
MPLELHPYETDVQVCHTAVVKRPPPPEATVAYDAVPDETVVVGVVHEPLS